MKKVRLKPQVSLGINIILIIILSIVAFLSTTHIYTCLNEKAFVMNYKISNKLEYKVYIIDNQYYQVEYLEMGKQYQSIIISNIVYNFKTTYKSSKETNLKYSYKIIGEMVSEAINKDSENGEIWNKEYILVEEKSGKVNSNKLDISENVVIDYQKYEELMEKYKKEFAISMNAYYKVKYDIRITDEDNSIVEEFKTTSIIPLLESTVKMSDEISKDVNENIYMDNRFTPVNIGLIIFTLFIYITIIILIIKSCRINLIPEYLARLNKILKMYSDIIITVDGLPEGGDLEIIDLKDFESLVDLEQELRKPIMHAKVNQSLSVFAIYTSNFIYRYVFDEKEFLVGNN